MSSEKQTNARRERNFSDEEAHAVIAELRYRRAGATRLTGDRTLVGGVKTHRIQPVLAEVDRLVADLQGTVT
jgi:hypothetical protein